jgi:SAM-dependent methyltransferase
VSDRTASYYDRIAADYDAQVDGSASNRAMRDAFRTRVSALAGPSGTILDYGCGTGTDAAWYAARGHRVVAYDVSAGMLEQLRARCAEEVSRGVVVPVLGDLAVLDAALRAVPPIDVVAANFAALNHVPDLAPVLETLAEHLRPTGVVVASLLNPLQRTVSRRRWLLERMWLDLWRDTVVNRGETVTYRHQVRTVRRMARRWFDLEELAHADRAGQWSTAPLGWRDLRRHEFRFFVLRRRV